MPTNTWQAYNMYDRDGDGWGDTWYAGGNPPVELDRPVPRPRRAAALQGATTARFLSWLQRTGKPPDIVADDDLEAFAPATSCARSTTSSSSPGTAST